MTIPPPGTVFPHWLNPSFHINFVYHLKILQFWHQSINYFSLSVRNVFNRFCYLIGFLRVTWNNMFTVLNFWLSQAFKFLAYGILIIVTIMTSNPQFDFCNSETVTQRLCFLSKKTRDRRFLFYYTKPWTKYYIQIHEIM